MPGLLFCGEYRSRTDDLLHAMHFEEDKEWYKIGS